jgi:hypothetical protein
MTKTKKYYFQCTKKNKDNMVIIFDFRLEECIKSGYDLVLKYNNREMLIPFSEIKNKAKKLTYKKFPSKYNGKNYGIYHFKWKPNDNLENLIEEKQQKLL